MRRAIELSCDLGEARTAAERELERALWPLIRAANVACGGHVGDDESMRDAARCSLSLGTILGAHPSYPDREGFGRRRIDISAHELEESLVDQVSRLTALAAAEGVVLTRVKPHGALYNDAHRDGTLAAIILAAVTRVGQGLAVVAAPGSALLEIASAAGLETVREAFADRRYRRDGSLVPRGESGALLMDPADAAAQAVGLAREGVVRADDGSAVSIAFETLCVHGDMSGAEARLLAIRGALSEAGMALAGA